MDRQVNGLIDRIMDIWIPDYWIDGWMDELIEAGGVYHCSHGIL